MKTKWIIGSDTPNKYRFGVALVKFISEIFVNRTEITVELEHEIHEYDRIWLGRTHFTNWHTLTIRWWG